MKVEKQPANKFWFSITHDFQHPQQITAVPLRLAWEFFVSMIYHLIERYASELARLKPMLHIRGTSEQAFEIPCAVLQGEQSTTLRQRKGHRLSLSVSRIHAINVVLGQPKQDTDPSSAPKETTICEMRELLVRVQWSPAKDWCGNKQ